MFTNRTLHKDQFTFSNVLTGQKRRLYPVQKLLWPIIMSSHHPKVILTPELLNTLLCQIQVTTSKIIHKVVHGPGGQCFVHFQLQQSSSLLLFVLKVEAASKLRCNLCVNKRFTSLKMYDDHMASKNHRKKELRKDISGVWVCQACDLTLNSQTERVRVF